MESKLFGHENDWKYFKQMKWFGVAIFKSVEQTTKTEQIAWGEKTVDDIKIWVANSSVQNAKMGWGDTKTEKPSNSLDQRKPTVLEEVILTLRGNKCKDPSA